MKCFYYLAPTLESTQQISEDLHEAGISDWYLHVVTKDEAGLARKRLHSSNYLETMDLLRTGFIGANVGFIAGVIGAGVVMYFEPFGPLVPGIVYFAIIAVATLFGSWEGGLYGVAKENQKLTRFHDDLKAGKYLILIYARKDREQAVTAMMQKKHPESQHVATDPHFFNPFSVVRRDRATS